LHPAAAGLRFDRHPVDDLHRADAAGFEQEVIPLHVAVDQAGGLPVRVQGIEQPRQLRIARDHRQHRATPSEGDEVAAERVAHPVPRGGEGGDADHQRVAGGEEGDDLAQPAGPRQAAEDAQQRGAGPNRSAQACGRSRTTVSPLCCD